MTRADVVVYVRELDADSDDTLDQVEALQQAWVAATGTDQDEAGAILINQGSPAPTTRRGRASSSVPPMTTGTCRAASRRRSSRMLWYRRCGTATSREVSGPESIAWVPRSATGRRPMPSTTSPPGRLDLVAVVRVGGRAGGSARGRAAVPTSGDPHGAETAPDDRPTRSPHRSVLAAALVQGAVGSRRRTGDGAGSRRARRALGIDQEQEPGSKGGKQVRIRLLDPVG